ncbi:MAG: signal peptidase I [Ruminococcus sp.]|uniref:signal peptidase I n=1 Tax=Ruminococcus sp. TaxID=41978 RepID=UPI0025DE0237|nr:signal peptidase I [Ruminococcus sp.]MCR5599653.1 signal peptidase I [Ruminococcus sp.]
MSDESKKEVVLPSMEQVETELDKIKYKRRFRKTLLSTVSILIVVAAVAVLVSTLFFPVVQVAGNSMAPTLKNGDILLLIKSEKVSYGDLCCVSWQNKTLLKRVIGLSGDKIDIDQQGNVYVNDVLIDEPYVSDKCLGICEIEFPYHVPDNKVFILGDIDRPNLIQNNEYRATSKMPILRRF